MFGIYIHIPFCSHRCPFCDFTVVAGAKKILIEKYINSLCQEINLINVREWPQGPLTSVYLGGGTPSLIEAKDLRKIIEHVSKCFQTDSNTELTLETNPEDVEEEKAEHWIKMGINRISLGVQSMDDAELKRLGRHHTSQNVKNAFHILRNNGCKNISVDLMYGLENQSLEGWEATLKKTVNLRPDHISTYNLTIEKNTGYEKEWNAGKLKLPSDDSQADMMIAAKNTLMENKYDPYEISNAALRGYESRHNLLYWTGQPYLGLGLGAHSFQKKKRSFARWVNHKNITQYGKHISNHKLPIEHTENIEVKTHIEERLMTGLRLKDGLDLDKLKNEGLNPPLHIMKQIQLLKDSGHLQTQGGKLFIPVDHAPMTSEILLKIFDS